MLRIVIMSATVTQVKTYKYLQYKKRLVKGPIRERKLPKQYDEYDEYEIYSK